MDPNGIFIYAEQDDKNNILPVVLQLLSKARELKEKIWNQRIVACVIGGRINYDEIIKTLGDYGADEVVLTIDNRLKDFQQDYYSEIFTQIAKQYNPRIILTGVTKQGKALASYVSAELNAGLSADCTNLNINNQNLLIATRPTFGGQLTADITCKSFPQMATVQENVFQAIKEEKTPIATFNWIDIDKIENRIEILNISKHKSGQKDITKAEIIVAGGKAACKDNGFALIHELAHKLGGTVAGTREAFEKGYITKSQQVGQTGKTVAPKLYIAVGISGANQHIVGIKNSKKIIAINNDPNAPIFKHSNVGIVGDLFEVIPKLINEIDIDKEGKNE